MEAKHSQWFASGFVRNLGYRTSTSSPFWRSYIFLGSKFLHRVMTLYAINKRWEVIFCPVSVWIPKELLNFPFFSFNLILYKKLQSIFPILSIFSTHFFHIHFFTNPCLLFPLCCCICRFQTSHQRQNIFPKHARFPFPPKPHPFGPFVPKPKKFSWNYIMYPMRFCTCECNFFLPAGVPTHIHSPTPFSNKIYIWNWKAHSHCQTDMVHVQCASRGALRVRKDVGKIFHGIHLGRLGRFSKR